MRARTALLAAVVASALAGCDVLELGTIGISGEVADTPEQGDSGNWHLTLVVDPEMVDGLQGDVLQVRFDADELSCIDGTALTPESLEAGWTVNLDRVGDDIDDADPPIINGQALAVDCPTTEEGSGLG
ncbi:MAG: hypothetical protein JJT89_17510 [Nitriliruptoraceae bacterium]|nr:hypothetical protein [Nitriliruptoraceae bacterium]